MNNFQRVFHNTIFLTASEFTIKLLGVVWVIFLARSLSIDLYGRYSFVNAFVAIFSFLPDLGVGLIVIRDIAREKTNASLFLGNAFILNFALACSTFFLMLFIALFISPSTQVWFLISIAAITLVISTIRSVSIFYFDGIEKMHFSAFFNALNMFLLLLGGFIFYIIGFGLPGVFLGMLAGTIISTAINWYILLSRFVKPKIQLDKKLIIHFLSEGLPLGIAAFASLVYTRIDTILLTQLLGEKAAGIYSSATPFAISLIQLLNVPFVVAIYPALSRLSYEDKSRFNSALKKSFFIIALWSFPCAFLVAFLAPTIIPLIFGQKYREAIPILQVLIFYVPFLSLSALLYKVLIILHKQRWYLGISLVGAFMSIILNIILIPQFAIMGAAYASIITQVSLFFIYSLVVLVFINKFHEIKKI